MSVEMPLNEDHEVLGSEFCSSYSDALGRYMPGFYCPPPREDASDALFCCGGATYKYCCTQREHATGEELGNLPLILGAALGATAALAIIILVSCCCCSCCALYKSRNSPKQANNGPVYRMQTSSTASGVANMYSFSNQNSLATTPIDTAASQIMVELEPGMAPVGSAGRTGTMGRGNTFSASGARTLQRNGSHDPPPPYDAGKSHHTLPHQRHHHQQQHHQQQQQQQQHHPQQQHPQQHLYPGDSPPQVRQHFTLPRSHGMAPQGARSPITTFPQGPQGGSTFGPHPTATLSRVPRAAPAHHAVPVPVVKPPPGPLPPGPQGQQGPQGPQGPQGLTSPTQRSPVDSPLRGFQTHTLRHPPPNTVSINTGGYGMTHSTSSTFQPCPPPQQQMQQQQMHQQQMHQQQMQQQQVQQQQMHQQQMHQQQMQQMHQHQMQQQQMPQQQPMQQQQIQQQQMQQQQMQQQYYQQQLNQGLPPPPNIPAPVPAGVPPVGPMPPTGPGGPPKGGPGAMATPGGPPNAAATTNGGTVPVNAPEQSPGDTLYRSTKF